MKSQSFVIGGLTNQHISVTRPGGKDAWNNGSDDIPVYASLPCRYVDKGEVRTLVQGQGPIIYGTAKAWIEGDVDIRKGDKVVLLGSGIAYTVINMYKSRDVVFSKKVDHTKIILE